VKGGQLISMNFWGTQLKCVDYVMVCHRNHKY